MNWLRILALVVLVVGLVAVPATATDYTFTGGSGRWDIETNWSPNGEPDENDNATIPYNQNPYIPDNYTTAKCRTLTMAVSGGTRSSLSINSGAILTVGNGGTLASTVDGDIIIGAGTLPYGSLRIDGTHTIAGEGGTIELKEKSSIIPLTGSSDLLIIAGDSGCEEYPDDPACSLVVFGTGTIKVPLDNRAFVVARNGGTLKLDDYDMTGTSAGHWIAETNGQNGEGTLAVGTDISGACHWLIEADSPGTIFIGHADVGAGCVAASGPVTLKSGLLLVPDGSNFCTSGKLTWKSVSVGGVPTRPAIETSGAASASFGMGNPNTCSACNVE